MIETVGGFVSQIGKRKLLLPCVGLAMTIAALVAAVPASAGLGQEYTVFADCPVNVPGVITCVYSKTTSGEFTLGSKTVAIDKEVILQGGISSLTPDLVPAADGNTLSRTPLTVPGGLVGVAGLGGEVTATAELAGPVKLNGANLLTRSGTAVTLPLKVKLDNPVLGASCYIGSEAEPVEPHLTTGTTNPPAPNKPISGSVGNLTFAAGENISLLPSTLVDNAFSVPGVNGCGPVPLVTDPVVDLAAGLPSAAGHNTAIMTGILETTPSSSVKAQAALPELGRCVLAESTGEGRNREYHGLYENNGCTRQLQNHEGKYEWVPGAAKPSFKGKGAKLTLEGVGGAAVACASSSVAGEFTGEKTLTASVALKGCKTAASKATCQSTGAKAGEIVASGLTGDLGFISDELSNQSVLSFSVGLDLSREPSLLSAQCAGVSEELLVTGSVIGPIAKADAMTKTFKLTYTASAGHQSPEQFEVGSKDTLGATLGAGSEQAGLTTKETLTNEEPLEIKAATLG